MKDLTFNKKDKKDFIISYLKKDDRIIVKYADSRSEVLPYSIENIRKLEKKMISQALDTRHMDEIDKKIKISNLVTNYTTLTTIVSAFALGGFALTRKEGIGGAFLITAGVSAVIGNRFSKRREKLLALKEEAEKYKMVAENLDKFNNAFNEKSGTRDLTMNDADSFDKHTFKKLLDNIK